MSTRRSSLRPFFVFDDSYLRRGFTLVEVLVTLTLTLILLTAVVKVFSGVGDGISKSRKTLETFDRLRLTEAVLREDLAGATASTMPPWRADENKGYFEYIENGLSYDPQAMNLDSTDPRYNTVDTTVGQRGDILMFTTRSRTRPFIGRCQANDQVSLNPYVQSRCRGSRLVPYEGERCIGDSCQLHPALTIRTSNTIYPPLLTRKNDYRKTPQSNT